MTGGMWSSPTRRTRSARFSPPPPWGERRPPPGGRRPRPCGAGFPAGPAPGGERARGQEGWVRGGREPAAADTRDGKARGRRHEGECGHRENGDRVKVVLDLNDDGGDVVLAHEGFTSDSDKARVE